LRDRIDFHVTRYREATFNGIEAWVTCDGNKIFGAGNYHRSVPGNVEWRRREHEGMTAAEVEVLRLEIIEWLNERELHATEELVGAMRYFLDMSVSDALKSDNPFVKALAIIDRRVGSRTLAKIEINESEHSLVKAFYELRCAPAHI
jgi:hypothetical protein